MTEETAVLETATRRLAEVPEWDTLVRDGDGATVFHERWFLDQLCAGRLLCIHSCDGDLRAGLPLFETGGNQMQQSSLSSPYAGPVFAGIPGNPQRTMMAQRALMTKIAHALQARYRSVSFSLSPQIHDAVAFIRAGFIPEVRYTYIVDLNGHTNEWEARLSRNRRANLARARRTGITVLNNAPLECFDVARAVDWSRQRDYAAQTTKVLREAVSMNRGQAMVAMQGSRPVAGLFLVWDRRCAYTTHAYIVREAGNTGASTLLYLEAMAFARDNLQLGALDLEGSVLPGVEEFYQSFGGRQTVYFRLHWCADRADLPASDLYNYS